MNQTCRTRTRALGVVVLLSASALALQTGIVHAQTDGEAPGAVSSSDPAETVLPPTIRDMTPAEKTQYDGWIAEARAAMDEGNYEAAQPLLQRILDLEERAFGPEHLEVAGTLGWMASNLNAQGRYREAEPLYEHALGIYEAMRGPDHPDTATGFNNLAGNLYAQGRYAEAQPLYERALSIYETILGPDHPATAASLNNLAGNLHAQARYAEAQPLYERALSIYETILGPDHPDTARTLNNLALNLNAQGRYAEAQPLYERTLRIYETRRGPDHPDTAGSLNNLAGNLHAQGRLAEALKLYQRALNTYITALGSLDYNTALESFENSIAAISQQIAMIALQVGDARLALSAAADATDLRLQTFSKNIEIVFDESDDARQRAEIGTAAAVYVRAVLANAPADRSENHYSRLFEYSQLLESSAAGRALNRTLCKRQISPGGNPTATRLDGALLQKAGLQERIRVLAKQQGPDAVIQRSALESENTRLAEQIDGLIAELKNRWPEYLECLKLTPATIDTLRAQTAGSPAHLGEREAAVLLWPGADWFPEGQRRGIVFVVTREGFDWAEVGLEPGELQARIDALRQQLDPEAGRGPDSGDKGTDLVRGGRGFDRGAAFDLYQALFGDARIAALLADKDEWILSPQGSLLSLPFAALPMAAPLGDDADPQALSATAWLGADRALTVLPNLSTLQQVRGGQEKQQTGPQATSGCTPGSPDCFLGFGYADYNPASPPAVAAQGGFLTQAQIRANAVRTLSRLGQTRHELQRLAQALGAVQDRSTLFLDARATEAQVKALSEDGALARARVIAFATHGLIPDQLDLDQAALAFTPPEQADGDDDGLLTAAEASALRLNADWVILSACNTASSDQQAGSEALAGLARAFFFAGARSLLVSHWAVGDADAATLTSTAVQLQQQTPGLSRARALQQAMNTLRNTPGSEHPTHWAPFIIVGAER